MTTQQITNKGKEKTTRDKILEEYQKTPHKQKFMEHLAEHFGRSAHAIKNNWFCGFKLPPKAIEEEILKECIKYNVRLNKKQDVQGNNL